MIRTRWSSPETDSVASPARGKRDIDSGTSNVILTHLPFSLDISITQVGEVFQFARNQKRDEHDRWSTNPGLKQQLRQQSGFPQCVVAGVICSDRCRSEQPALTQRFALRSRAVRSSPRSFWRWQRMWKWRGAARQIDNPEGTDLITVMSERTTRKIYRRVVSEKLPALAGQDRRQSRKRYQEPGR